MTPNIPENVKTTAFSGKHDKKLFAVKKESWTSFFCFFSKFTGSWGKCPGLSQFSKAIGKWWPWLSRFLLSVHFSFSDRTARMIWVSSKMPAFHSFDMRAFIVCMLGSMGRREKERGKKRPFSSLLFPSLPFFTKIGNHVLEASL